MKRLIAILAITASSSAFCDTAYWTGRMHYMANYSHIPVVECEYNYYGEIIWQTFHWQCENTIEVQ